MRLHVESSSIDFMRLSPIGSILGERANNVIHSFYLSLPRYDINTCSKPFAFIETLPSHRDTHKSLQPLHWSLSPFEYIRNTKQDGVFQIKSISIEFFSYHSDQSLGRVNAFCNFCR
mmetsp:Transcript_19584/g.26887  ORF Transcript_19584/g.26887 Transcript_19584/m.26887 type:complete len:117 (-) Transcript_19584:1297-1647(-)